VRNTLEEINRKTSSIVSLLALAVFLFSSHSIQAQEVDRTVLPQVPAKLKGKVGETYKDSTPDFNPALPLAAPEGAPNVLVIVLDDVG
jgi:arylsulfatase